MPASRITADERGQLKVPDEPIVPFVEGDGVGAETCRVARRVVDAAVARAYGGVKRIAWLEVAAGDKAVAQVNDPAPDAAVNAFRLHRVGLQGPLRRNAGHRHLEDELREVLDLSLGIVPLRALEGPLARGRALAGLDLLLLREEREEAAPRIDLRSGSPAAYAIYDWLAETDPAAAERLRFGSPDRLNEWLESKDRLPTGLTEIGVGLRQVSRLGSVRFAQAAADVAQRYGRTRLTFLREAGEPSVVEQSFLRWTREALAGRDLGALTVDDANAAGALETLLTRPAELSAVAGLFGPTRLLLRALARSLGGTGLLGSGHVNALTGHAVFRPMGTPQDDLVGTALASPAGFIVAGELLLRHLGWTEAAAHVRSALDRTLREGICTGETSHLLGAGERPATIVRTGEFGDAVERAIERVEKRASA